ncbi:Endoribonuclease YbeY [Candidatus Profftia lariciata]|uniref:rRNA maturation RNase YbeY n=1 Tax=Candidatus Profftia lariciata TaxID=1987921 RepID=UPI001D010241|nr:rRNA maturation RNase YbeY [Candidatus Profftia lariciata]UDG81311.1 Endoribonuclease YbeY [Candidatus Profftia lariciata]
MSNVILDLQIACKKIDSLPTKNNFRQWLEAAIQSHYTKKVEVTIRLIDNAESYLLNMTYRGQNKPTNVLSFPFTAPISMNIPLLGDIIICRQLIEKEAKDQKINVQSHWAHIVIHGVLHLLGYNHILEEEATKMETLEMEILHKLKIFDCIFTQQ